ncbi:formin 8 [Euphorbia peplus]|nr:formin 8 [Euphorbia peplus]
MNFSHRRWLLFIFVVANLISLSSSQSNSQNLETFYPFSISPPAPSPVNPPNSSLPPSSSLVPVPEHDSAFDRTVVKAVVATAASTFVLATLLFFLIQRQVSRRRRRRQDSNSGGGLPAGLVNGRISRHEKGETVDENGLDMLYWRQLQEENKKSSFQEDRRSNGPPAEESEEEEEEPPPQRRNHEPEIPLLRGKSSFSQNKVAPEITSSSPDRFMASASNQQQSVEITETDIAESNSVNQTLNRPPPPPPAPPRPRPPPIAKQEPAVPPPPPPKQNSTAPTPPGPPGPPGPPPQPMGARETSGQGNGSNQVKLKPLHWDKVNKNTDHSMVWDKIGGGSFRVDDGLMEALFGYVATNRKPERDSNRSNDQSSSAPAKIAILDPKKSRNTAIVLKTISQSPDEILEALGDGRGLDSDTLEKLTRIALTKDEEFQILKFNGEPDTLADAESFLFHILQAVPSAFSRVNAMLFRLNYDSEVLQFKESLQTLELGCKELRTRGLFMKLLEAVLKAGNRMNEGTSRGNAQAFDLASLQKLSDVKSTDGKTTLLNFIVEEVIRSEGKRCVISRNRSLSRAGSSGNLASVKTPSKGERAKEYIMLGLPLIGGLSAEFANVKNAAQIDYSSMEGTCSVLSRRMEEIRQIGSNCSGHGEDGFVREMKGFLESAELEIEIMKEEQIRIMELVRATTEYYQAGGSKNQSSQPLGLFVIIKDFLNMVDQACIEITREVQKRKPEQPSSDLGSPPKSPALRMRAKFPNLPDHFLNEKSKSSSSESDTEF